MIKKRKFYVLYPLDLAKKLPEKSDIVDSEWIKRKEKEYTRIETFRTMLPVEIKLVYKEMVYRDSFVFQFMVEVYNREYLFTGILNNEYFLKQNYKTMALFAEYLCFPKTYESREKNVYVTENKRNVLPLNFMISYINAKSVDCVIGLLGEHILGKQRIIKSKISQ